MASYALPLSPAAHAYNHGHTHSHAPFDRSKPLDSRSNGASPFREQSHDLDTNGHAYLQSNDATFALKSASAVRTHGRYQMDAHATLQPPPRGGKFGFSPILEAPASQMTASSWLDLPEALTAFLIPLPFFFASLAYRNVAPYPRILANSLLGTIASPQPLHMQAGDHGENMLHACTLSSATLILVGSISRVRSTRDQPLDRRKSFGQSESFNNRIHPPWNAISLRRLAANALSTLLPFYAATRLGGAKTALILLAAATAGLGTFDQKPGKHTTWENARKSFRSRKWTCSVALLCILTDMFGSANATSAFFGYAAILTSVLAVPSLLPTIGWSLLKAPTLQDVWGSQSSARASLPKPTSPLISTPQDSLNTIVSGLILALIGILYHNVSSSSPFLSHTAHTSSAFSIASAMALVYFSLPSALRSQNKVGFMLGCIVIAVFGFFEYSDSWQSQIALPLACALVSGAIFIDTRLPKIQHAHTGHRHSHSHDHHVHHLHGNHSRLSAFLIGRCTPGSILHSILIEKDSRRIAYFGALNLAFMVVQFFYGFVSGSLGLLTDSIHMLFDCAGLAVGLAAAVMSKWRPNARFPYGFGKVDTLSGFANGVFLLLVSVEIIFDAFERLWEGHELHRLNELLIVSVLGFLVNIVGLTAFGHAHHGHGHSHDHGDHDHSHAHSHDNENMQGIFLHILADALGSVAVIISTLLTKYYGWSGWDPIASCIIAVLIFGSAIPLVKSSGMRLMLSLPADVEYGIRNALQELSSLRGVIGYAVPKFWKEDEGAAHADVHAQENGGCSHDHTEPSHSHHHSAHDHHHSHAHEAHGHSHLHTHEKLLHKSSCDSLRHHMHDHEDEHPIRLPRILGVIHIIASQSSDLEDVRERATQFLKGRGMDVVVHVEKEGESFCWCGGGVTRAS